MDRYLIAAAVLALFIEVTWLLGDLNIIDVPFVSDSVTRQVRPPAGVIEQTRREVRRRGSNSLIWENPNPQEPLYFFDSFLTLEQSAATLQLRGGGRLNLSENTLVVIEPADEETPDRIRLRFSQGSLRAGGFGANTQIQTESWLIEADEDAELNLRQTGEQNLQVEMIRGKAKLRHEDKTVTVVPQQTVSLSRNEVVGVQTVDRELHWLKDTPSRIYTHQFPVVLPLQWQGHAEFIEWVDSSGKTQTIKTEQNAAQLALSAGTHFLQLKDGDRVSAVKEIEVWQAPVIHLFSPLPRDRRKLASTTNFTWDATESAAHYRLQISASADFTELILDRKIESLNFQVPEWTTAGKFHWRVLAYDRDQVEIPPLYSSPVYFLENPLAPPRLNSPVRKKESPPVKKKKKSPSRNSFLRQWFINTALAAERKTDERNEERKIDVYFSWQKVAGAESYILEISDRPDFREPLVIKKLAETFFSWKKVPLGVYYWRVAAEGTDGEMGLFSAVSRADLSHMIDEETETDGLVVKPSEESQAPSSAKPSVPIKPPPAPPKTVKKAAEPSPPPPPPSPPEKPDVAQPHIETPEKPSRPWGIALYWLPSFINEEQEAEEDVDTQLNGFLLGQALLSFYLPSPWSGRLNADLLGRISSWQAKSTDELPFQTEVDDDLRTSLSVFWSPESSGWHWGIRLAREQLVSRADNEIVNLSAVTLGGAAVKYVWSFWRLEAMHEFNAALGTGSDNDLWSVSTSHHLLLPLGLTENWQVYVGTRVQANYLSGDDRNSLSWSLSALLGIGI